MKYKLIRITTVPQSLDVLLKGQLEYMSEHFEVIGISSLGEHLNYVKTREGIRVIPISISRQITPFKDLVSLFRIIRVLAREKPLIVHTHTPKAGLLGMLASKILNVPIRLHTVAGLPLVEAKGIIKILLLLTEKLTYKCSTKIYSNSFRMMEYLVSKRLINQVKIKTIANGSSNGIDINYYDPQAITENQIDNIKSKYCIKESDFVFIFIGRVVKDKGINELISAFSEASSVISKIKLLIIGEFEMDLNPISTESMDGIYKNNSIFYLGYKYDIRPYLAISNAIVLPSYREGFPNVVLQAGAFGLPSIVSNINGCNEIITDGYNGILIEPKDIISLFNAMVNISTNDDLYFKLKKNCRKAIVERFDQVYFWEELSKEYFYYINKYKSNKNC